MLLGAAMIWGAAFVAQTVGMDYVEPFTFQAVRCFLASIVLVPVVWAMDHKGNPHKPVTAAAHKTQIFYGVVCGVLLFAACSLQQLGLQYVEDIIKDGNCIHSTPRSEINRMAGRA